MNPKTIYLVCLSVFLGCQPHVFAGQTDPPDVIAYDNGVPLRMDINSNALFAVRFTPVKPFNLTTVYAMFRNDYNTTDGANVWVAQNNGGLPVWPAVFVGQLPPPLTDSTWIRLDLAGPMYFDKDFFVVVQQKGGPSPGPGFRVGIDYGTTTYRTFKSYDMPPGCPVGSCWLDEPLGDACIRAGGFYAAPGVELTPTSGAVIIEQVDFRGGPNSRVGEITVFRSAANTASGLTSGYVNATDSDGQWIVRNLPVLPDCAYDMPSITTRLDLGVENGVNVTFIDLYVEYSPEPYVTFAGGPTRRFNVGTTTFAAGGVGSDLLTGYLPGPDLSKVVFDSTGAVCLNLQKGHKNEQAANNQCAPMAVANSLDWLRTQKSLPVPQKHEHKPGLRSDAPANGDDPNDPSLVGELERAMNRGVRSRRVGNGVWPLDGKLKYISDNGLKDKLDIKHQGNGDTGGNPSEAVDGTKNITRHGVTSSGKGAKVTWEWLCEEIKKGEDVEIDIYFSGGGRHYVNVTGCGKILGKPYITHVSDHAQTDVDPNDTNGTDKVDFAWMDDDLLDHPKLANWNGQVDQALSESVKPSDLSRCGKYEGFERYCSGVSGCCAGSISQMWMDGTENHTGSIVKIGTAGPDPCPDELELPVYPVHSDEQSMVVIYQNSSELAVGFYSEVTADTGDIELGKDWTATDADQLSLWIHGEPNNTPEPIYVAVQDGEGMTAVLYHDDPLVTLTDDWTKWSIPLYKFVDVDLTDVRILTIGIGHRGNTTIPGSIGIMFFDDIGLCESVPACLAADTNYDCLVDFKDLAILAESWLQEGPCPCTPIAGGKKQCRYRLKDALPLTREAVCPAWAEFGAKCVDIGRYCLDNGDCDQTIKVTVWANGGCELVWELYDCAQTLLTRNCRNPGP